MRVFGSLILLILFIAIYMIIAEIFVMLFRITGVPEDMAQFQVISMLTNSGYTTKEAEHMISTKARRKISMFVILFGYAFTVTIVSTIVNVLLEFQKTVIGSGASIFPIISIILLSVIFVKRSNWINKKLSKFIQKLAIKTVYTNDDNEIILTEELDGFVIAKIIIKIVPEELKELSLKEINLQSKYGINLLYKKTNGNLCKTTADTQIEKNDILVVMGEIGMIRKLFIIKKEEKNERK